MKVLIALIFTIASISSEVYRDQPIAIITLLKGRVDIISLKTGIRKKAELGMKVLESEQVRTASKSKVNLELIDTSKIELLSFSVLNIKTLLPRENFSSLKLVPIAVRLLSGKVKIFVISNLQSKSKSFYFLTPTLMAGGTGANYSCVATLTDARLAVQKGKLKVANRSKEFRTAYVLSSKQEIQVVKNKNPFSPRSISSYFSINFLTNFEITKGQKILKREREAFNFLDKLLFNQHAK